MQNLDGNLRIIFCITRGMFNALSVYLIFEIGKFVKGFSKQILLSLMYGSLDKTITLI